MNMRPLHFVWMSGTMLLLSSCVTDTKVGEYPLPRHGGSMSTTSSTATQLAQDVRNTSTLGSGIGDTVAPDQNPPVLPSGDNLAGNPSGGQVQAAPPVSENPAPAVKPAGGKYPYAIVIPNDPDHVLSPYDRQKVNIRMSNGRRIPSGKVIRAQGETDPNRKFIIP